MLVRIGELECLGIYLKKKDSTEKHVEVLERAIREIKLLRSFILELTEDWEPYEGD